MFALFMIFSVSAWAHTPQDGDVYLAVLPTAVFPRPGHYSGLDYPALGGLTIEGEGDLDKNGGVEVALVYMPYLSSIQWGGQVVTEKVQRLHISTGYRYWFNKRLSLELGFFAAYSMGQPVTIQNDYGTAAPVTSASDSTEYGFDTSFQVEPIHFGSRFALLLEARFAHAVTQKPREDEDFFAASVGLKFFLQSREEDVKKD